MYARGGIAYIYLCYGVHHLFNVVTGVEGDPHAVLIRGIEPVEGLDIMLSRRKLEHPEPRLTAGPGSLSVALGLDTSLTGQNLLAKDSPVWLEDRGKRIGLQKIKSGPRVGMNFSGKWATIPWRFSIAGNPWVSSAR
jgi:DNA-3-methyladenine glycosylase